jgi:hypothetical protein
VILVDANILLYAYNSTAPQHRACRKWLESALSEQAGIALSWPTILGFLRLSTDARVFRAPRSWDEAEVIVASWLEDPGVYVLQPGTEHWAILQAAIRDGQVRGPMIMDAHLAALAIEHGAVLCTNDRDFTRFTGLRLFNPLESEHAH